MDNTMDSKIKKFNEYPDDAGRAWDIIDSSGEPVVFSMPDYIAEVIDKIQAWGIARNITEQGGATAATQIPKLQEELCELREAVNAEDEQGIKDGIGDMIVVLIQICRLRKISLTECLLLAYDEIKGRRGQMINGIFVKDGTDVIHSDPQHESK